MGQQQLLLIVLGLIIVGVAIIGGISLFSASAVEAKRNAISNDLVNLSAMAQQHYRKPSAMGGGNRAFDNSLGGISWVIPPSLASTGNGSFEIQSISRNQIIILATGNEVVTGNDSVKVQVEVLPNKYQITILN